VSPGVYAVSLVADTQRVSPTMVECPIRLESIEELLAGRPELRLDGRRPTASELADRVRAFWLPDEVILYIGLAGTSLTNRLSQYYRTRLGGRSPHAGGWFLKLLTNLDQLYVHWSESMAPSDAEDRMVAAFCANVSDSSAPMHDPQNPLPFANLRWPRGAPKRHGISGATGDTLDAQIRSGPGEGTTKDPAASRSERHEGDVTTASRSERQLPAHVDVDMVNRYIQGELRRREMYEVPAVEAARWLDEAGLLRDSQHRSGLPLRKLLRARQILGQRQETNRRWFIDRIEGG